MHTDYKSRSRGSLHHLESVAAIRFAIMEVARVLYFLFSIKGVDESHKIQQLVSRLMQHTEEICVNATDTSDISGPALYLLKMIVRQFGFPCLNYLSEDFEWIIPNNLRDNTKVCFLTLSIQLFQ